MKNNINSNNYYIYYMILFELFCNSLKIMYYCVKKHNNKIKNWLWLFGYWTLKNKKNNLYIQ